jgi:streptomycin 6-kinase
MVVIKASPPGNETRSAIASLSQNVHPQLVHCDHSDIATGIQVLTYVPGNHLPYDVDATAELEAVGYMLAELHQLTVHPLMIPLSKWCHDLLTPSSSVPHEIWVNIERCERLLATSQAAIWLHGDLHHGNIIQHSETGQLVAIDPKGLIGEPSFDICTFVRNHVPQHLEGESLSNFLERRIRTIGDAAGYPTQRTFAWAAAGNALSLVWDLPASGELITDHQCHLYRVLTQLNLLADRYGNV